MQTDYRPIITDALSSVIAVELKRLRAAERGADYVFGQFGQLCWVEQEEGHEGEEFAAIFVGGVFEAAFYATTKMVTANEWHSSLISVPFVLEAKDARELRAQLRALEDGAIAQRCLFRSSESRDEAYGDLYALAARCISSQAHDFPLWQQQIHTFYAQAFTKASAQEGIGL